MHRPVDSAPSTSTNVVAKIEEKRGKKRANRTSRPCCCCGLLSSCCSCHATHDPPVTHFPIRPARGRQPPPLVREKKPKTKVTDERYVALFQLRAFRRLVRPSSAHFLFLLLPAFRANRVFSVTQPIYTAAPATAISPMLLCDQTFQRISSRILAHNEGQMAPESTTDVVPGCPVNTFVHCLRPKFECWWRMDLQARMLVLAFFR